jgi:hypothetical protein
MDIKKQSQRTNITPQEKIYCDFCECHHSYANRSQHYKTQKHIKAKKFKESLLKMAKSKMKEDLH